jgi:hypothetical membrane protein
MTSPGKPAQNPPVSRRTSRVLLLCGAIGASLFVVVALVEGALRPGYDAIRLPISLLSLSDQGWIQTFNFRMCGALMVIFAVGLWLRTSSWGTEAKLGAAFVALFGLGLVGAGLFPADPGGGYPPGARVGSTDTGTLHDVASLVVFVSLAVAAGSYGRAFAFRGKQVWAWYSVATAALVVICFALMFYAFFGRNDLTPVGGLIQRAVVLVGWLWVTLLAIHLIRLEAGTARRAAGAEQQSDARDGSRRNGQ